MDVSGSQRNLIEIERSAASQFFSQVLRKKDEAFLISFGEDAELLQDYTGSPTPAYRGPRPALQVNSGVGGIGPGPVPTASQPRGHGALRRRLPGGQRKAEDRSGPQGDRASSPTAWTRAAASRSTGHRGGAEIRRGDLQHRLLRPGRLRLRHCSFGGGGGEGALRKMSDETGGHMYKVDRKHTLDQVFKELQDEMRSQYAIGYTPTNDMKDGSYRKLDIKLSSKDLKAQARKGYYAIKPEAR